MNNNNLEDSQYTEEEVLSYLQGKQEIDNKKSSKTNVIHLNRTLSEEEKNLLSSTVKESTIKEKEYVEGYKPNFLFNPATIVDNVILSEEEKEDYIRSILLNKDFIFNVKLYNNITYEFKSLTKEEDDLLASIISEYENLDFHSLKLKAEKISIAASLKKINNKYPFKKSIFSIFKSKKSKILDIVRYLDTLNKSTYDSIVLAFKVFEKKQQIASEFALSDSFWKPLN